MKIDQKVIARLDELIQMGEKEMKGTHRGNFRGTSVNDNVLSHQFATSSLNLLSNVFGE